MLDVRPHKQVMQNFIKVIHRFSTPAAWPWFRDNSWHKLAKFVQVVGRDQIKEITLRLHKTQRDGECTRFWVNWICPPYTFIKGCSLGGFQRLKYSSAESLGCCVIYWIHGIKRTFSADSHSKCVAFEVVGTVDGKKGMMANTSEDVKSISSLEAMHTLTSSLISSQHFAFQNQLFRETEIQCKILFRSQPTPL